MKLFEHGRPIARCVGMGKVRPDGRLWVPHEPYEGRAVGVLQEDVHLEAEVVGRVGAGGLAAGDAGVDDGDVVHPVLRERKTIEMRL